MNIQDIRTVEDLIQYRQRGKSIKYLHFWGHTPKVPGVMDASCLSQWFSAPFTIDGTQYPTAEHYMMAEKARLFNDDEMLERIIAAKSPGEAKKLGRQIRRFDDALWKKSCFEFVVAGNVGKFSQNQEMRELLLRTGNKVLVEASPRDRIWGIGMGRNNQHAEVPEKWRGKNLLGFALMEVRYRLQGSMT